MTCFLTPYVSNGLGNQNPREFGSRSTAELLATRVGLRRVRRYEFVAYELVTKVNLHSQHPWRQIGSMQHDALHVQPGSMGSDSSLIEAIASGNEDALAEFVRRHRRTVFAVVLRVLSCSAVAEEVVQDVFVQVWKHALRFRGDSKVTTWLHTIARNAAVTRLRRVDDETTPLDLLLRARGDLASEQPNPERQAAAAEFVRQTWSRIRKLPATHRAVVVGIVRHGSPTTVAARQHIGPGPVRSRLHRGRLALRAVLEDQCRSMP